MSGTVSSGHKADRQAGTARGGSGRRWVVAGVVIVVVVAGVAVAAAAGAFKGSGSPGPGAAGTAYRTSVATVTRRTLTAQSSLSGTLADSRAYTVVNQAAGTLT